MLLLYYYYYLRNLKFLMYLYFHQHEINLQSLMLLYFPVTKMPIGVRNLSLGFIQLRTPARINICSVTQQPPGTKLNTV